MSESAQQAIDEVRRRLREIETQLADSAVLSDPSAMGRLGKRHARLRHVVSVADRVDQLRACLLYTSPSPRDRQKSRMPSSA